MEVGAYAMLLLLRCIVSRNILISIRNAQSLATVCDSTCSTYDTLKLCIIIIIIITIIVIDVLQSTCTVCMYYRTTR